MMSGSLRGIVRQTVWICRTVVTDSTVRGHSARRDHRGKGRGGCPAEKLLKTDQMTTNVILNTGSHIIIVTTSFHKHQVNLDVMPFFLSFLLIQN